MKTKTDVGERADQANPSVLLSDDPEEPAVAEALADLVVIVIGDNHLWGKSEMLFDAVRLAGNPKKYVAYVAKPDTQVYEMDGSLIWTRGFAPKVIARKGFKKKN